MDQQSQSQRFTMNTGQDNAVVIGLDNYDCKMSILIA